MGVAVRVDVDTRGARWATRQLQGKIPKLTAQVLNRQAKQSRTRIVREVARASGVTPQKRVRRRVILPRGGRASPLNLEASGLTLFETMPTRYFKNGTPIGANRILVNVPDAHGRSPVGGMFTASMPSGFVGEFRRLKPKKWVSSRRTDPRKKYGLPIANAWVIDLTPLAYAKRELVLQALAKEFPNMWQARLRAEINRIYR